MTTATSFFGSKSSTRLVVCSRVGSLDKLSANYMSAQLKHGYRDRYGYQNRHTWLS